jgi:hypothetical protein
VTDRDGTLLTLAPLAWGPKWNWAGWKVSLRAEGGTSVVNLATILGPDRVPVHLEMRAAKAGSRQVAVVASLTAEKDCDCTAVVLAIDPGQRYTGGGTARVISGEGTTKRDVPFGYQNLGAAVTALRLGPDQGGLAMSFAAPALIQAHGQARLVLGTGRLVGGMRSAMAFTIDLPDDIAWYATPMEVPQLPGFETWFPWQPEHALDDQGALGMKEWLAPITEPAKRVGDRLQVADQPARFWGLNLCYSQCSPPRDLAERRAELYAKYGFNAVRLHKYADGPGWAGIQSPDSFAEFDLAGLDRFDWQVAKLKEQGIRIKLSPTFGLQLGQADRATVPWLNELGNLDPKKPESRVRATHGSVWFMRELQELQIRQTTSLLKHRNPYTGLTYAEDPVVLVIELYNEDSALFFGTMAQMQKVPTIRRRASEAFSDWLAVRYTDQAGLVAAWGPNGIDSFRNEGFIGENLDERNVAPAGNPWFYDPDQFAGSQKPKARRLRDTMRFLYEAQNAFYDRFVAALRTAGYSGEVLASNWIAGRAASHFYNLHSDARIGMIDRHNYCGGSGSLLANAGSGILSTGLCQVAGLPFSLSEWIHCRPNEYGVEGPAIIGAYGMGLQGWDVSFMFENGDDAGFRKQIGKEEWDVMAPHILGLQPLVARQVLRGDVAESVLTAPLRVHLPSLGDGPLDFTERVTAQGDVKTFDTSVVSARALAVARCQTEFTSEPRSNAVFDLTPFECDGALVSSTGQLRWYEGSKPASGCFTINTPATKAVVGFAAGRRFDLGSVAITPRSDFAAIYLTAAGRADSDLATAPRLLLGAVARARNTGMKVLDGRIIAQGAPPVLMEPVRAEIVLADSRRLVLRPLDQDGRRNSSATPVENGRIFIDTAVDRTIYWEISVE